MRHLRLIKAFAVQAFQNVAAYRLNFWISLLNTLLNFATGILGIVVLFSQVDSLHGWTLESTLALLGTYLTLGALRNLFIGPSLEALCGMDGEVWTGQFDFTLMKPVDTQFMASFRHWRPLHIIDLLLGVSVLIAAIITMGQSVTIGALIAFIITLFAAILILYSLLLAFSGLVFWSPGFLFTWLFNALFQMARYPVGVYPGWLRLVLTWIIPVGVMTTIPAEALSGTLSPLTLVMSLGLALLFFTGSTWLFRSGLRRYASASS